MNCVSLSSIMIWKSLTSVVKKSKNINEFVFQDENITMDWLKKTVRSDCKALLRLRLFLDLTPEIVSELELIIKESRF